MAKKIAKSRKFLPAKVSTNKVTFATFKTSGKIPVSNDRFTSSDNQREKKVLNFFKRNTGTPKGPVDFLTLISSMIFSTSAGPAGER